MAVEGVVLVVGAVGAGQGREAAGRVAAVVLLAVVVAALMRGERVVVGPREHRNVKVRARVRRVGMVSRHGVG